MARCPSCKGPSKGRDENPAFPFCSSRCRAVDLGKWFQGEYRVPGAPAREEAERPASSDSPDAEK